MAEKSLGFIGLGDMGAPMAGRLLDAGYTLSVFDVRKEAMAAAVAKGATACSSPADVASREATVMVSLPTPDVVRTVALGPDGIVAGTAVKTYIDLSPRGASTAKAPSW